MSAAWASLFLLGPAKRLERKGLTHVEAARTWYRRPWFDGGRCIRAETPWSGFAPARVQCGQLIGANFNSTADQAIPISVPTNGYMVDSIVIDGPSASLTTAAGGFYSAASKGGVIIVAAAQAYSALTTSAANTTGNALLATISTAGNTTAFSGSLGTTPLTTLYLALTTGQGSAATANVRVYCRPLYR
jgi:hypothetical protein